MIRRSDRNQSLGTLRQRCTAQVGHAMFGDDDIGQMTGSPDKRRRIEPRHDARHRPSRRTREQRKDRPSAARQLRPAREGRHAADTGNELSPERVAIDLAEEIHFQRSIDRDEVVDGRDAANIVGLADRCK